MERLALRRPRAPRVGGRGRDEGRYGHRGDPRTGNGAQDGRDHSNNSIRRGRERSRYRSLRVVSRGPQPQHRDRDILRDLFRRRTLRWHEERREHRAAFGEMARLEGRFLREDHRRRVRSHRESNGGHNHGDGGHRRHCRGMAGQDNRQQLRWHPAHRFLLGPGTGGDAAAGPSLVLRFRRTRGHHDPVRRRRGAAGGGRDQRSAYHSRKEHGGNFGLHHHRAGGNGGDMG